MASKAKICLTGALFWGGGGGGGVRDMAPPSLRNLGAKFSETPFPILKTYFMEIGHCYL